MKHIVIISSLLTTLFLTGCGASFPLGMNEEQWSKLTPQERETLLVNQQKQNHEARLARIEANAKNREMELEMEKKEKDRLDRIYSSPSNGNLMMVNILGGTMMSGKTAYRIQEETYQIARGETKEIELITQSPKNSYTRKERAYLKYIPNGNGIYLYLDNPDYSSSKRISLLRDGRWECGTRYKKNIDGSYEKLLNIQFYVKEVNSKCRTKIYH